MESWQLIITRYVMNTWVNMSRSGYLLILFLWSVPAGKGKPWLEAVEHLVKNWELRKIHFHCNNARQEWLHGSQIEVLAHLSRAMIEEEQMPSVQPTRVERWCKEFVDRFHVRADSQVHDPAKWQELYQFYLADRPWQVQIEVQRELRKEWDEGAGERFEEALQLTAQGTGTIVQV